jgi:hypothetical protein
MELPRPYPLSWPPGRLRIAAAERERDRYEVKTVKEALGLLDAEINRWRAPPKHPGAPPGPPTPASSVPS